MLTCEERADPEQAYHPNMLHVPLHYDCARHGLRLSWFPHAYPFYTGQGMWSDNLAKHSPSHVLRGLPSSGKYVILIHLYLHFSLQPTSVYVRHVRDAARAVRDLLARNSQVTVFVRGPHALCGDRYGLTGDFHAERCARVLGREFRGLRDRVVFLNAWDMTVALESCDLHPPRAVLTALVGMLFDRLCSSSARTER